MPIHETDQAEERWEKAQWSHYELWEKLELKLRRRRLLWIAGTAVVFLALSSVPIILDRAPKWTAMSVSRRLAQVINGMKSEASLRHQPYRIRFVAGGSLDYELERVTGCSAAQGELVRRGSLQPGGEAEYVLLSPEQAQGLGLPGIVNTLCYDPYTGNASAVGGEPLVGFGILVAKDLTDRRSDRLSVLLVQGSSAELSFD